MDILKNQFDRIQQQLGGLNATQKMLVACLVAIIVMTVVWWGRYAAVAEMEPLFDKALSAEDLGRVRSFLKGADIPAVTTADNRISVPSDRRAEAIAGLTFSNAMPATAKIDFTALVKDMNPFNSASINDAQLNNIKQLRLAEVISNFPGVKAAQVFIDSTEKIRIGGGGAQPSATVSIETRNGEQASQQLVDAAANLLRGAQAGLSWKNVTVMVDGVRRRVRDPEDGGVMDGGEQLKLIEEFENRVERKVAKFFEIPSLAVTVSYKVNPEAKRTQAKQYDKDNIFQKATEESERTLESSNPVASSGGEPGARPNTGMTIDPMPAAGSGQATTTENEIKSKFQVLAGETVTEIMTPAGVATPVAAAVRMPRSHIIRTLKQEWVNPNPAANPNALPPEPREADIQARFKQELPDLRTAVKIAADVPSEQAVLVSLYTDLLPQNQGGVVPGAPGGATLSAASFTAMAGAHSREIVLGGLAVVSLFMVSMMVRRSSPLPVAAGASVAAFGMTPMPVLDATESLVGEVSEGKSLLDAMELDEDAVRAQQMLDQVSSMVEENPDAAAGLVKRWMNRA